MNPYLKTKQASEDYLSRKHLQIEVPPGVFAPVDQHLKSKRKTRDISHRIGNLLTPPAILAKSDLLLTYLLLEAKREVRRGQSYTGLSPHSDESRRGRTPNLNPIRRLPLRQPSNLCSIILGKRTTL
jgi:hypothetical protein